MMLSMIKPQLAELIPENSLLEKPHDEVAEEHLQDSWVALDETVDPDQLEEIVHSKEAHANAMILKSDEDLYTIFSRFGTVALAEIIRGFKTGDSLCYAFIDGHLSD